MPRERSRASSTLAHSSRATVCRECRCGSPMKYLDRPLGFLPDKLSLRDALTRGRDVVRAYFHQWKLGELQ
ncbi:hypothetical protein NFJ02_41g108390 [Pycnococcus provasolii]